MKQIFVFGSNRQGRHGAGAALEAKLDWGAKYGQAEGLQGNSYAIVTKELRRHIPPVTLDEVGRGVEKFLRFASDNKHMQFLVTPIGCGLAGFTPTQIAQFFKNAPSNVLLPDIFDHCL